MTPCSPAGLAGNYAYKFVDHAVAYFYGHVHTNGLKNFWSLLKRGINGTYVSVDRSIRFAAAMSKPSGTTTRRIAVDAGRFAAAICLTYAEVIGKWEETVN